MKMKIVFDVTDADTIAASDSIGAFLRSSDGTLLTHSTIGGKEALDVSIADSSIEVTATDLDIRDLDFATDSVDVSGSSVTVSATDLDIRDLDAAQDSVSALLSDGAGNALTSTAGALDINIASGSITVTEEDVYAEDSAHTSGDLGGFILAVRQDTLASSTSDDGDYAAFKQNAKGELYVKDADVLAQLVSGVTVSATDLDIRDLAFATDSVDVSGSSVTVSATDLDIRDLAFATDSVDVSGSSVTVSSTDLDIRDLAFATDSVDVSGSSVEVNDAALADTAIAAAASSVTTTSAALIASALSDRKYVMMTNTGNRTVFVGPSGVSVSSGFPLHPGSLLEMRAGAAVVLHAVSDAGTQNVRTLQLS
jgi:hypothetical protein